MNMRLLHSYTGQESGYGFNDSSAAELYVWAFNQTSDDAFWSAVRDNLIKSGLALLEYDHILDALKSQNIIFVS